MDDKLLTSIGYVTVIVLVLCLIYLIRKQIRENHLQYDPILFTLKEITKPIHPIFEKIKLYKGEKSYTINKERIFLCLKDSKNEYYNLNTLLYVLTHEVSHILTKSVGHTQEFWDNFDVMLKKAEQLGIYDPSIPIPQDYCEY